MWQYREREGEDGELLHDGIFVGHAYSGADPDPLVKGEPGEGKNHPEMCRVKNVGPIPPGKYRMSEPFFHETAGPYTIRLTPLPETETFGRGGFLIHGDSARAPGTASHGCIVATRPLRICMGETVKDGDDILEVV